VDRPALLLLGKRHHGEHDDHQEASTNTTTTDIPITQAKADLCAVLRRIQATGESINITRRGKVVAKLAPVNEDSRPGNIATDLHGLFADCPEACDEIDKAYAERYKHKPRYVEF